MNFKDDQHALKTGFTIGAFMTAGLLPRPVMDDQGNYTDTIVITLVDNDGDQTMDVRVKVLP